MTRFALLALVLLHLIPITTVSAESYDPEASPLNTYVPSDEPTPEPMPSPSEVPVSYEEPSPAPAPSPSSTPCLKVFCLLFCRNTDDFEPVYADWNRFENDTFEGKSCADATEFFQWRHYYDVKTKILSAWDADQAACKASFTTRKAPEDLVVHVGACLYREGTCSSTGTFTENKSCTRYEPNGDPSGGPESLPSGAPNLIGD